MRKSNLGGIILSMYYVDYCLTIIVGLAILISLQFSYKDKQPDLEETNPIEIEDTQEVIIEERITYSGEPKKVIEETSKEVTEEIINQYIINICNIYNQNEIVIEPELVMSIVWHESRYNPKAVNNDGSCVGLMQVSKFWHKSRAYELGVEDFFDPEGNILLGVDYIVELKKQYKDIKLVLMLYNMMHDDAFELYEQGEISYYAKSVLERAELIKNGGV